MNATIKQKVFLESLASCLYVWVFVDSAVKGVSLPANVHKDDAGTVPLTFGMSLPVNIPDLIADDRGISATLSFGRKPFPCFIPWAAVICITDRQTFAAQFDLGEHAANKNAEKPAPPPRALGKQAAPLGRRGKAAPTPAPAAPRKLSLVPNKDSDQ